MSAISQLSLGRKSGEIAFGLDAEGYHAARLPYPDELYDELFSRLTAGASVLEIGPGTGLVTQALLSRDVERVTAVEPDRALAAFTVRRLNDPRLTMVEASFEDARIDGQFDLVACAAAFHWLDPETALTKAKALLKPGGLWAMWWHSYRNLGHGDALADLTTPLFRNVPMPPSWTAEQHYSLDEALHRRVLAEAGFGTVEYRLYRSERELTTDAVVQLYKSYSFVRLLPDDEKTRLLDSLAELVEKRFSGRAPNLVLTPLYFASA